MALAACVAGGAFAQNSVGGGGILNYGKPDLMTAGEDEMLSSAWQYGAFAFFDTGADSDDLIAAEFSIAILTGPLTGSLAGEGSGDSKATITALEFALLLSVPITINDSFIWYPIWGAGYNHVFSIKYENGEEGNKPSALSTIRIYLGVGGDYTLTEKLYLRGQLLGSYAFGLLGDSAIAGFGGTFKIGVGYRF